MQITLDIVSLHNLIPKSHDNSLISVPIQSNKTSSNKTTITHIAEISHTKCKNQSQILLIQFASYKHEMQKQIQNQKNKSKTLTFLIDPLLSLFLFLLLRGGHGSGTGIGAVARVLVFGIPHHDDRTDAVVDAVVADAAESTVVAAAHRTEPPAPHDHGIQAEPLDLQAQPLPHVVVLHDVDLVRDLRLLQRPREIGGLRRRERVEVVLQLPLRHLGARGGVGAGTVVHIGGGDRVVDGAPVGAEEDLGGADVEEDHGVARTDVVIDGPAHGVGRLVREIDGHANLAAGPGGGRRGGRRGGGVVARGGRVVDFDGWELRMVWVK